MNKLPSRYAWRKSLFADKPKVNGSSSEKNKLECESKDMPLSHCACYENRRQRMSCQTALYASCPR